MHSRRVQSPATATLMAERGQRQWTEAECREKNRTDPRIHEGYECQWVAPFGWVPEAGCPVHD